MRVSSSSSFYPDFLWNKDEQKKKFPGVFNSVKMKIILCTLYNGTNEHGIASCDVLCCCSSTYPHKVTSIGDN